MKTAEERFHEKVEKTDDCWIWTGGTARGYGQFRFEGKNQAAHRVAYKMYIGDPGDKYVSQTCDTKACVNPDHLQTLLRFTPSSTATLEERFWQLVDKGDPDDCWEWAGDNAGGGYGRFYNGEEQELAHRVSYRLHARTDPGDRFILHHCDNKPCVNPRHLYMGTHDDNMEDAVERNRHPSGEDHYASKLTDDEREAIRDEYEPYQVTQKELAEKYGVTRGAIKDIVDGRKELSEEEKRAIRDEYVPYEVSQRDLATKYGVSQGTIRNVLDEK